MCKKTTHYFSVFLLCVLSLLVVSCGGSAGGIDGTGAPAQRIIASGTANTTNDTLNVNGINIDASAAVITIDGNTGLGSEIEQGQVLSVEGTLASTELVAADQLQYISNVIGPIESIDDANSSFVVLGQQVGIDNATILGNSIDSFDDFSEQMIVRVSGLISSNRNIQATRIDEINTSEYQVLGLIETLDQTAMTFTINNLTIDYSDLTITEALFVGALVKVNGNQFENNIFQAKSIEKLATVAGAESDLVSLEGLVTRFMSGVDFSVSDVDIVTNDATIIENGTIDDIDLDARLRVEGILDSEGQVVAARIFIIHTGPISFKDSISKDGGQVIYTLQSNDKDTGLWVTLTDLSDSAYLQVFRVEGSKKIMECRYSALSSFNNGVCYLQNNGQTTWEILVGASSGESETSYSLTAHFRRASFSSVETIDVGEPITVFQNAGDRNLYQLSAVDAPPGSFLAVRVDGLQNNGQMYIQGDRKNDESGERLFDCRLGNRVLDRDETAQRICWLKNEGVDNWYLTLDSVFSQQYTIYIEFIVPDALSLDTITFDSIDSDFDRLYKIEVPERAINFGVLMSDMNQKGGLLSLNQGSPPSHYNRDCVSSISKLALRDEQCLVNNNSESTWYVLVAGDKGLSYSLNSQIQTEDPAEKELTIGQTMLVSQEAATIAHYRIPQGPIGTAFLMGIEEHDAADFRVEIRENIGDRHTCRLFPDSKLDERHCRVVNNGTGYWYITIKSVVAGNYTLWTDQQDIVDIQAGESFRDQIIDDRYFYGVLYRIAMPETAEKFVVRVTEKTSATALHAIDDEAPRINFYSCSARLRTEDNGCEDERRKPEYWYILINGDPQTEYTLTADFE
jgi:hypothetical protein